MMSKRIYDWEHFKYLKEGKYIGETFYIHVGTAYTYDGKYIPNVDKKVECRFTDEKVGEIVNDEIVRFHLRSTDKKSLYNIEVYIYVNKEDREVILMLSEEDNGRFAGRESFDKFLNVLKRIYFFSNPNHFRNLAFNINGSKAKPILPEDVNEEDNFWKFLTINGYSWKEFEEDLNIGVSVKIIEK